MHKIRQQQLACVQVRFERQIWQGDGNKSRQLAPTSHPHSHRKCQGRSSEQQQAAEYLLGLSRAAILHKAAPFFCVQVQLLATGADNDYNLGQLSQAQAAEWKQNGQCELTANVENFGLTPMHSRIRPIQYTFRPENGGVACHA